MKNLLAFIFALAIPLVSAQAAEAGSETTEGCLYSRDEIKTAFGGEVTKIYGIKMAPAQWGGRKLLSCHYVIGYPSISSLTLGLAISGQNTDLPKKLPDWVKGTEQIPGDPDGALWRIAGPSSLQLIYFRGNTEIKIDITHDSSQLANIKRQALMLRRVP